MNTHVANPNFIVFTGNMFSGKTSNLLMTIEKYKFQKKKVICFKPKKDVRYSEDQIVSHMGWKQSAYTITDGADLIKKLSELEEVYTVIAVDEMFMIPGIADTLIWLYRKGFTVLVSTLDLSSAGKPFGEVTKILPWATEIKKCAAVCTICGRDAHYTYRKIENQEEIVVGGEEAYEARCFEHHVLINKLYED
jgi:thymidine kinase